MFPVKQSTSVFHLTAQVSFSTSRCYFLSCTLLCHLKTTWHPTFPSFLTLSCPHVWVAHVLLQCHLLTADLRIDAKLYIHTSDSSQFPQQKTSLFEAGEQFVGVKWSTCSKFEQTFSPSGWCIHSIGDWCSPNPWRQKDSSNSVSKINHVINPEIMTPTLHASAPRAVSIAARSLACTCSQVFFDTPPMIRFPRQVMWKTNHQKGPRPKKRQYIPKRPKVYFFQIYPRDFRNFYQTHTCLQVPQLLTASAQPRFGASQQLVTNKRQLNLRLESAE